jgi:F-box and WD-40 domain protein 1/11
METMTTNSGNDINNEEHSPMLTSSSSNCLLTSMNNHSNKISTPDYEKMSERFLTTFSTWDDREQIIFVENLLKRMHSHQHGQINTFLLPMLQRDFIGQLAARGLDHIAEKILGYLDDRSLTSTELVCHDWYHVISAGMKNILFI